MSYIVTGDTDLDEMLQAEASGQYEIVGAAAPSADDPSMARAIERRDAVVVQQRRDMKLREYPLGFDSLAPVPAAATATIATQPQVLFRVERLVVPSDIAGAFVVEELTVGKNPQLASLTAVPARIYDERAVGVRLKGDTAQVSMNVSLRVTNVSGAAVRFRAAVIGAAID